MLTGAGLGCEARHFFQPIKPLNSRGNDCAITFSNLIKPIHMVSLNKKRLMSLNHPLIAKNISIYCSFQITYIFTTKIIHSSSLSSMGAQKRQKKQHACNALRANLSTNLIEQSLEHKY